MIDSKAIRNFWEKRGAKLGKTEFESIANLEPDPELLAKKIADETKCIMPRLALTGSMRVLDLGAGVGQWAIRIAPQVREVVAVEYAKSIIALGQEAVRRMNLDNVRFVECAAEDFTSSEPFDLVFISGLLLYLVDEQADKLVSRLPALVADGGRVCLRDGTSILPARHIIDNRWSETLGSNYSALYRTRQEYLELFARHGFIVKEDCQVFEEGSPLNKYPETRLRLYLFTKSQRDVA